MSLVISRRAIGPGTGDITTLPVCPSVRPSRLLMYVLEILQVRAPCHGDVLYSFWYWWNVVWIFMNFLNIEKNIYFKIFFLQYFMFSSRFMLLATLKKNWCKKTFKKGQWESISNISSIPFFWFFYLPRRRRPGTGDIATPPVRPSVCLSVTFIDVCSRNFAGTCTMSWGCAVQFLILMECCLNFLWIF